MLLCAFSFSVTSEFGSGRRVVARESEEVGMCGLSDVCLGPRVICFSLLRSSPLNLPPSKCKHTYNRILPPPLFVPQLVLGDFCLCLHTFGVVTQMGTTDVCFRRIPDADAAGVISCVARIQLVGFHRFPNIPFV